MHLNIMVLRGTLYNKSAIYIDNYNNTDIYITLGGIVKI